MERVEFVVGTNGKPLLAGDAAGWGFNLSHAGRHAVAVLARGAAVGVDLESTTRRADIERLAQRLFSESEQSLVRTGGRDVFFTLWSQKEALMKALGCGWADGHIQRRTQLDARGVPDGARHPRAGVVARGVGGGLCLGGCPARYCFIKQYQTDRAPRYLFYKTVSGQGRRFAPVL
jgi:hypothetical protein